MQVLTVKAKPGVLFGAVLALTGIVVIILTFALNHPEKAQSVSRSISCSTAEERLEFLKSLGYEAEPDVQQKEITVPAEFNSVYNDYNEIQKEQGLDLEPFKGKQAVIYTYNLKNYEKGENVIANLIVCDGRLIGADVCDPSAENGFLEALIKDDGTA